MFMGATCTSHTDANGDKLCDTCGASFTEKCKKHKDLNHDGVCDSDGCTQTMKVKHYDLDHDGVCDDCGKDGLPYEHTDEDYDRLCDICDTQLTIECDCYDEDLNGKCDVCRYPVCTHRDVNKDGKCDKCKEEIPLPPPCEHKDENRDGKCDECKDTPDNVVPLVNSVGKTTYKIVLGKGLDADARRKVQALKDELKTLNVYLEENSGAEIEYEILFGEVSGRDAKYSFDVHELGLKGYTIRIVGKKIIVLAGSYAAYINAIAELRTDFFKINEQTLSAGKLTDVYLYPEDSVTVIQNDYKITQITLFGEDIRDYKIAHEDSDSDSRNAANQLQKLIYEKSGYWLEVVKASEITDKAIFFLRADKCGETGFSAEFEAGKIVFTSEYGTTLGKVPYEFFFDVLENTVNDEKVLALSDANEAYGKFTKNAHYVYYDDFGAAGDGVTNDADVIYEAHWFACNGGHKKIVGTPGKCYYIGELASKEPAPITCDVDWTGVEFIIDDREEVITNGYRDSVFRVQGAIYTAISPSDSEFLKSINANGGFKASEMTAFDLGLGYKAMLVVTNSTHKNYIRNGVNEQDGVVQSEIIVIDENGNIDPTTLFLFDYEKITNVEIYRIDEDTLPTITIDGGKFTTIAHNVKKSGYTGQRGITVKRSNTVIKNLEHYVTGEVDGLDGPGYPNFMDITYAYNVLVTDSVFTARKYYKASNGAGQGTYDITTHFACNVIWQRCTESNFYKIPGDPTSGRPASGTYWGINGGGNCKNITYKECLLSRYDAHRGVMNAYIIDSIVGSVDVCGGGDLHIINSTVYGVTMLRLREDYGSFWHGDLLIKDVTMVVADKYTTAYIFDIEWKNWYFGYPTALPTNITIDGLKIDGAATNVSLFQTKFTAGSEYYKLDTVTVKDEKGVSTEVENKNVMAPPKTITVKNNTAGYNFIFPEKAGFFDSTEMIEIK